MKTEETINIVCSELGITKAELAKRMGMLPSSLYRKLSRESMTFAENPPDTFDMIFMDIMMPKMNGYEATAAIRSMPDHPDARRIPIIAMTANAFAEDVQASLDVGMNGHLSKPIVMEEVIKAIARNVNR